MQFFGKIAASVTHELNNVLGLIDETAGLIDDLLGAGKAGDAALSVKLERITERIHAHSARGVDCVKRLNAFVHTVDEPLQAFDLAQVTGNLAALSGRFASMRKMQLTCRPHPGPVMITSNPFRVQQIVFAILILAMNVSKPRTVICLETGGIDAGGWVGVEWNGEGEEIDGDGLQSIIAAAATVGACISFTRLDSALTVRLDIPGSSVA